MERGFPMFWGRHLGRQCGPEFYAANMQNENFWRDSWDWQQDNHCPDSPPAWAHRIKPHNYNVPYQGRGGKQSRRPFSGAHPSRGHHRGSKSGSSKERSPSQNSSSSLGLINMKGSCALNSRLIWGKPNKKRKNSEKVGAPSAAPKSKQRQENSASLVKETDPPKVDQKSSKTIMSPKDFSFRWPSASSTCPEDKQEAPSKEKEEIEIKLKDSQTTEDPPSQTAPMSPVQASSKTAGLPDTEKEKPMLVELKDTPAAEEPPSQVLSVPSAEASIEDQTQLETTESIHTTEKELPVLTQITSSLEDEDLNQSCAVLATSSSNPTSTLSDVCVVPVLVREKNNEKVEARPPKDQFNHCGSPPAVEIPFLSDTTNDNCSEGKEDIELTQITSSLEDEDLNQSCAVLATSSSNPTSTLNDVRVVPVLVREKKNKKHYSWETGFHAGNSWGWAPEDCQEPPCNLNEVGEYYEVSEHDSDLMLSQPPPPTPISCEKSDTGRLLEYCPCSPKSRHSSNTKHSSADRSSRELHFQHSRSPHRKERSHQRRDGSPCSCSPKNQHSSDSRHSSTSQASRELHIQRSRSPHRRERCHRSSDWSPHSCSQKGQHSSDSKHSRANSRELRIQRSRSPHRRERSHGSSDLSHWRRAHHIQTDYSSSCHCEYCYNPHQKNFYETDSPPSYLIQKRNHRYSPKERSKLYKAPHSYCHESPRKKIKKKISPRKTEKKTTTVVSEKATKSTKTKKKTKGDQDGGAQKLQPVKTEGSELIQAPTSSEDTDPPHPTCAGEKDGFSSSSRTSEDRSAAVLARKEEIDQAYQRVLLNFAVVAAMLLESKPCMEEAMEAALRANLRRIGNYYECMLRNFIDSYDLADAS